MTLEQVKLLLLRKAKPYANENGSTGVYGWCAAHGVAMTGHPAAPIPT